MPNVANKDICIFGTLHLAEQAIFSAFVALWILCNNSNYCSCCSFYFTLVQILRSLTLVPNIYTDSIMYIFSIVNCHIHLVCAPYIETVHPNLNKQSLTIQIEVIECVVLDVKLQNLHQRAAYANTMVMLHNTGWNKERHYIYSEGIHVKKCLSEQILSTHNIMHLLYINIIYLRNTVMTFIFTKTFALRDNVIEKTHWQELMLWL